MNTILILCTALPVILCVSPPLVEDYLKDEVIRHSNSKEWSEDEKDNRSLMYLKEKIKVGWTFICKKHECTATCTVSRSEAVTDVYWKIIEDGKKLQNGTGKSTTVIMQESEAFKYVNKTFQCEFVHSEQKIHLDAFILRDVGPIERPVLTTLDYTVECRVNSTRRNSVLRLILVSEKEETLAVENYNSSLSEPFVLSRTLDFSNDIGKYLKCVHTFLSGKNATSNTVHILETKTGLESGVPETGLNSGSGFKVDMIIYIVLGALGLTALCLVLLVVYRYCRREARSTPLLATGSRSTISNDSGNAIYSVPVPKNKRPPNFGYEEPAYAIPLDVRTSFHDELASGYVEIGSELYESIGGSVRYMELNWPANTDGSKKTDSVLAYAEPVLLSGDRALYVNSNAENGPSSSACMKLPKPTYPLPKFDNPLKPVRLMNIC